MNSDILLYNMNMAVQTTKKAIELRRLGRSYSDIAKELKVSRASVCGWVKNVRLTEAEKANLQKSLKTKIERGRMKASISIRSRSVFKEKNAYEIAEKEFNKFIKDPLFMLGIGFLAYHGTKKGSTFQFTNSTPAIIHIMHLWIEKYLGISKTDLKYRLFLALSHKNGDSENFWATSLKIPLSLFHKTYYLRLSSKKGREYNGSLSLYISRIEVIRKVIAWQKLTMRYYDQ